MNDAWWGWFCGRRTRIGWNDYEAAARRYARGFCRGAQQKTGDWMPLPTGRSVAAVVTADGDQATIAGVLDQLGRMPLQEIVVVANGVTDETYSLTVGHPLKPTVVHYAEPIGRGAARAAGAEASTADIVLFVDGGAPIAAGRYVRFVDAVERGADVALNDITPYVGRFRYRAPASVIDEFVNRANGRRDLGACSLIAVPHALSRRAIETIGCENLAVPALAQTIALQSGLSVEKAAGVHSSALVKPLSVHDDSVREGDEGIARDHLEAFHYAFARFGGRLQHPDWVRRREAVRGGRAQL